MTNTHNTKPSLLKQLTGAGVGAALAFALYTGYESTTAYISAPDSTGVVRVADKTFDEQDTRRLAAQVRKIDANAEELHASSTNGGRARPSRRERQLNSYGEADRGNPQDYRNLGLTNIGSQEWNTDWQGTPPPPPVEWMPPPVQDVRTHSMDRPLPVHPPVMTAVLRRESHADNLPNSGLGLFTITGLSLAGASALRKKRG